MLGLPRGEVFLVPWTSEWETEFNLEKQLIEGAIGPHIVQVHHIGSTAVKGLSAKPIIDIAVVLNHFQDGNRCINALENIGYSYRGTNILPERYYFNKGEPRTHQIHMYSKDNKYLQEQINFRNYLRENEWARVQYEELKQYLATASGGNKHQYAESKTEFVKSILAKIKD